MRTTAARWWAPAVTPAAIGLIALGSTSVALAGIDLTTSLRDPEPAAAPVETELTPVTPAGDGADEPIAAGDDDGARTEAVVEESTDDGSTPTPSITTPDLDTGEVDDALGEAVDEVGEAVTDVTDAVDLPGVGLGGARASNNAGGPQRADVDGGNGNGNGNGSAGANGNGGKPDEPPGQASKDDGGTRDQDADQPDAGDDQHPSGRDRSVEPGGSGSQGNAQSDPDDDGRGPDRSNGGVDQDGGSGGVDRDDQDGNNGCGNDDDFADDNEGWCGRRPRTQQPAPSSSASPSPAKGDPQPRPTDAAAGSAPATEASRSDTPPTAEEPSSSTRARSARRGRGETSVAASSAAATPEAEASDEARTAGDDDGEERVALASSDAGDDTRPRPARKPTSTSTSEPETRLVSARSGPGARLAELLDTNPAGRVVLATASTVSGAALAFTGLDAIVLVLLGAAAIGGGIALLRLSRRDVSRART